MRRFLPAVGLTLVNLALAPFLGLLRDWLFDTFPGAAVKVVALTLGGLGAGALLVALARIRTGRVWRFALLAVVVGLVLLQTLVLNRGNLRVDVVEKVHFVQYGLLAYLVYRGLCKGRSGDRAAPADFSLLLLPVLWGGMAGVLEEWVQWLVPVRTGEVLDVLLNTYAALCGTLFAVALAPPWPSSDPSDPSGPSGPLDPAAVPPGLLARPSPARERILLRTAALAVLLLAGFYHGAHLGYWVEYTTAGQAGGFRSWFTAEELRTAKEDRARRWATAPPRREALAVEDRYVSEAGWHIHGRNAAWQEQDWVTAWHESQILERYYAPFLDVPPLPGTGNYRLHPDQMEEIAAGFRALSTDASDGSGYASRVLSHRITLWPGGKGAFWVAALGLVGLLLLGGELLGRRGRRGNSGGKDGSSGGT